MKAHLSIRDRAIIRNVWIITKDERERLDHFFLLHDSWEKLAPDLTTDQIELRRFLQHESAEYEVILLSPVRVLEKAKELGLSFRVNRASNFRVVLIKEWKANENSNKDSKFHEAEAPAATATATATVAS